MKIPQSLSEALKLSRNVHGEIHLDKELSEALIRWAEKTDAQSDLFDDFVTDILPIMKKITGQK